MISPLSDGAGDGGVDGNDAGLESGPWFPYSSKLLFLLDAIDNLPRLRISQSLMKIVLWLLREAGVKKVPSFKRLRKEQKNVRQDGGIPTISCMSPKGNVFLFNDPRALITNVSILSPKRWYHTHFVLTGLG